MTAAKGVYAMKPTRNAVGSFYLNKGVNYCQKEIELFVCKGRPEAVK